MIWKLYPDPVSFFNGFLPETIDDAEDCLVRGVYGIRPMPLYWAWRALSMLKMFHTVIVLIFMVFARFR